MANINSLQKGLIAHYPLNGVSEAKDITPYANNGVITDATLATGMHGETNGVYSFNGTSSKIVATNMDCNYSGGFTWACWIYINTAIGNHIIDERLSNVGIQPMYMNALRQIQFFNSADKDSTYFSGIIPLTTWTHIAIKLVNGKVRLYINGVYDSEKNCTLTDHGIKQMFLGARHSDDNWFDGKIADVRRYKRALTDTEIKLLYESFNPNVSTTSLQKGLIAHYPLNGENLAQDITPYVNNGTVYGATLTTGIKGEANGAYLFNGTNQGISVATNTTQQLTLQGSVSAWFKCTGSSGTVRMIVDKYTSGLVYGFAIFINALGGLDFRLGNKGKTINTVNYTDSLWHNVVMTSDGTTMNFYVDGVSIGTDTAPTSHKVGSRTLSIGYRSQDSVLWFIGSITDVKIYNRGLSADEVKLLYDGFKPKASTSSLNKGLIFDSCLTTKCLKSTTIMADKTPNSQDGTIINTPTVDAIGTTFLNTSSQYISATNNKLITPGASWTMSIWFKSTDLNNPRGMIAFSDSSSLRNEIYITGGDQIRLFQGGNYYSINLGYNYADDAWHHIAGTFNGTNRYIYIDGVKYTPTLVGSVSPAETANNIRIGRLLLADPTVSYFFTGTLASAKIYNRALSDTEITLLFDKGRF